MDSGPERRVLIAQGYAALVVEPEKDPHEAKWELINNEQTATGTARAVTRAH